MKGYSALTVWSPDLRGLGSWADLWTGISSGLSGAASSAPSTLGGTIGNVIGSVAQVGIPLAVGAVLGRNGSGSTAPAQVPQNLPMPYYQSPTVNQPVSSTNYTLPIVAGVLGLGMLVILTRK